jgi:hypothetical protein
MFNTTVSLPTCTPGGRPFRLYENEDVEELLVDLGVGYIDDSGTFQYGDDPATFDNFDFDDSEVDAKKHFDEVDITDDDIPF